MTVYVTIGNSDNGLTQERWSRFVHEVDQIVRDIEHLGGSVHIRATTDTASRFQSATWGFDLPTIIKPFPNLRENYTAANARYDARRALASIAKRYGQWGIAWVEGPADMIGPDTIGPAEQIATDLDRTAVVVHPPTKVGDLHTLTDTGRNITGAPQSNSGITRHDRPHTS